MNKQSIINVFSRHVSEGKASFYKKYGMNFVMGRREGPWMYDIEGKNDFSIATRMVVFSTSVIVTRKSLNH